MKVAAIIKHAYRDADYRVDILEVPEDWDYRQVKCSLERDMLGPFQVISITPRLDLNRDLKLEPMENILAYYAKKEAEELTNKEK